MPLQGLWMSLHCWTQVELSISLLPRHPLINHQRYILKLHNSFGRDGCDLRHIEVKAIVQRNDLALHARVGNRGLALHLNRFTPTDNEVADLEVEGFFLPAFQA